MEFRWSRSPLKTLLLSTENSLTLIYSLLSSFHLRSARRNLKWGALRPVCKIIQFWCLLLKELGWVTVLPLLICHQQAVPKWPINFSCPHGHDASRKHRKTFGYLTAASYIWLEGSQRGKYIVPWWKCSLEKGAKLCLWWSKNYTTFWNDQKFIFYLIKDN